MNVTVYRKGNEIFTAQGDGNALNFPYGTLVERVESQGYNVRVFLAESPVAPNADVLEPSYAERVLVGCGKYIYAIKSYRTRTGVGLREAKLKMDDLRAELEREGVRYRAELERAGERY